ncbi:hypothetical protein HY493_02570 [Candidatus Woesearchaeota archaeon]|nr:hypothetical protein [Candidatus Woesearchaeota archaeon]
MKQLLFDAGPLISLTTNNLLWLVPKLKNTYAGEFAIVESVRRELVEHPLVTRKFKFEALQVQRIIQDRVLTVVQDPKTLSRAKSLLDTANRIFRVRKQPLQIVQLGEMETISAALLQGADAVVCDERITRTLIEAPHKLRELYERRLHEKVDMDENALHDFSQQVKGIKIIRSVELVMIAYEKGLLDSFLVNVPNARKELLESLLWGVKLHGAAISEDEIAELVRMELKR